MQPEISADAYRLIAELYLNDGSFNEIVIELHRRYGMKVKKGFVRYLLMQGDAIAFKKFVSEADFVSLRKLAIERRMKSMHDRNHQQCNPPWVPTSEMKGANIRIFPDLRATK